MLNTLTGDFNNAGELGGGVEYRAAGNVRLSIRGEYLYGFYYLIETRQANPYGPRYHTIRLTLAFGQRVAG